MRTIVAHELSPVCARLIECVTSGLESGLLRVVRGTPCREYYFLNFWLDATSTFPVELR